MMLGSVLLFVVGVILLLIPGFIAGYMWGSSNHPRSVSAWIEKEITQAGVLYAGQPATLAIDNGVLKLWNDSDSRVEYWLRITRDPNATIRRRAYQDMH